MNWAKARCRISVITLVLLGWSGAAWAQADHGLGFSRSNTTPLHVQDYYAIRFVITANQDTCGDRLQARDMAVEIRRDDGSVAYPTTWGFIELIRNTGYWTLENGAYWGDGAGTPNPAGPYIIFPPLTDPANPPRATGTADVAGTVRFPIYQVTQDDYAVGPTMNDTVTLRWYDECGGQCNDCVSGPYENSLDGTAVLASPSTNVDIIAYIDANGNGTFDEGEGVDSVCANQSVDLYITETNDGAYDLINVNVAIRQGDDATNTWSVLQNWVIGNLVQGATAELNILDVVITEETDFEAIGSGADPEGFLVTWCDGPSQDPTVVCDADEREVITVLVVETPPCEILVPEDVCAGSGTFQACFDGPPVVDYFKWELSGCGEDAPIVLAEGADVDCATVPVPAVGDCTLTVTLTTTLAGCVSQCQAQVTVNAPAVDLEKLVNGQDADVPTGPAVAEGATVTFEFVVINTGNCALTNVVVTDDVLGAIGTIAALAVGAQQTLTATAPALAGQHTNMGTVTTDEGASDEDPGNYFGNTPAVDLEKLVNGEDADAPTGPAVDAGSTVTFDFVVTNTGSIALTNLVVTDDVLGDIGTIATLAVGAQQTLTVTAPALAGQHTNMGTVTTDQDVADEDPGNYFGNEVGGTFCSFTQGYWGNKGGKKFGYGTIELISMLIDGDPIVVGRDGQSITFDSAQCIINLLPAGGPSTVLPAGDATCNNVPAELMKRKGRLTNTLVGQVVALSLNVRLADEGYFPMDDDYSPLAMLFDENGLPASFCVDDGEDGAYTVMVPEMIQGLTVQEVLDMANDYLGGIGDGVDGSALTGAVAWFNETFDECRTIVPCP